MIVHRTIGTQACRHLDPFLLLDHFGTDNPDEYIAGFPDHPHRGFVTVTYMLDGHMLHQDSLGNRGDLRPGGVQWMKAASGIIHSEMPQQTAGLMRGFQLWINLPAAEKLSDPGYQEFSPETVPITEHDGVSIRVIAGTFGETHGIIEDPHTAVQYFDVGLEPRHRLQHRLDPDFTAFCYTYEGDAAIGEREMPLHSLAVLSAGEEIEITAGNRGCRFILVAGRPINEPIVQYGPFVMNSREEIEQAFRDYHAGQLVRTKASFRNA